uniref:Secreted protein n=1 Tax=Macrostomum lignano TaxID=282301 RepID=A0A1I8HC38_9PLAT
MTSASTAQRSVSRRLLALVAIATAAAVLVADQGGVEAFAAGRMEPDGEAADGGQRPSTWLAMKRHWLRERNGDRLVRNRKWWPVKYWEVPPEEIEVRR